MRILTVCLGNICRSPAAEAILRRAAPDWQIDSAGTSDWHVGDPPYGPMIEAAKARGMDLAPLRARQATGDDFARFDLILAMDRQNLADLETLRPAGDSTPLRLFTNAAPGEAPDVPDPYYTRDFDGVLDLLERCTTPLVAQLRSGAE